MTKPFTDLIVELRPDVPVVIAESLAVEALDAAADLILDEQWASARARAYAVAVRAAGHRSTTSWEVARAVGRLRELARTPRPDDHLGGPVSWEVPSA
ncbi:hypothetical protein ABN034_19360 [Actinopolymorpha sp. B11F2]|uniref:hypothetical protein n=1 Tax=Actinopolymorpha sp. B11F2 TaxID=3160862 RepID=UPI0032E484AA